MSDSRETKFWEKISPSLNIITSSMVAFLYIHDKHDKEQRIYLKMLLFGSGLAGIINLYRYSGTGQLIDELLKSSIFYSYAPAPSEVPV